MREAQHIVSALEKPSDASDAESPFSVIGEGFGGWGALRTFTALPDESSPFTLISEQLISGSAQLHGHPGALVRSVAAPAQRIERIGNDHFVCANDKQLEQAKTLVALIGSHGVTLASADVLRDAALSHKHERPGTSVCPWTIGELKAVARALDLLRKHLPPPADAVTQRVARWREAPISGANGQDVLTARRFGDDVSFADTLDRAPTAFQSARHSLDMYERALAMLGRPSYRWATAAYSEQVRHALEFGIDPPVLSGLSTSKLAPGSADELDEAVRMYITDWSQLVSSPTRYRFVRGLSKGILRNTLAVSKDAATSAIMVKLGDTARVARVGAKQDEVYVADSGEAAQADAAARRIEANFRVSLDSLQVVRLMRAGGGVKAAATMALPWLLWELIAVEKALGFYVRLLGSTSDSTSALRTEQRWAIGKLDQRTFDGAVEQGVTVSENRTIAVSNTPEGAQDWEQVLITMTHELAHALVQGHRLASFISASKYWAANGKVLPLGQRNELPPTPYGESSPAEDLCESAMMFFLDPFKLKWTCNNRYMWWKHEVATW